MAEPIGALKAELSAGHAQFTSDMKKAKNAVKSNASSMSAAMDKVGKKFTEAATALNKYAGYAVAGAIIAATAFIKKQITVADKMGKLAQATGTTSEFLSSMALVASQGGTTLETVAKGVKKLSQNMYDVSKGVGEAKDAFDDLGIKVTNENGTLRNSEEVMKDLADRFKGMEDGATKTAYAMDIFGRAGAELIPMLNGGRAGIEGLQKKAQEMGLVISTETALQAAYFNDQLDLLIKNAQGTGRSLALQLIPWLNETMNILKYTKEESGSLMAAWVALGAVGDAIFGKSLSQKINDLKESIKAQEESMGKLTPYGSPSEQKKVLDNLKQQLADLEAQKQKEDNAEKARMEASLKRAQEEAEQRRKNTEQLIKDSEARMKAEADAAKAEADKKAELKAIEDAEKAATKAIEDQIKALEFQRDTFGMTTDEATLYKLSLMEGVTPAQLQVAESILKTISIMEAEAAEREKAKKDLKDLGDTGTNVFQELGKQIEGWGRDSSRAITDFALKGKGSFSDMVKSMIAEMLQLMIYQKLLGPLFNSFGNWVGGLGGGIAKVPGRAGGGGVSAGKMYEVNERGAPELLNIGNRQFLMMAGQSGTVVPSAGKSGGSSVYGGGATVNIYNNVGASVTTKERQTAGGVELDVMIDRVVGQKMMQQGSQSNKAIARSGGRTQLTGR